MVEVEVPVTWNSLQLGALDSGNARGLFRMLAMQGGHADRLGADEMRQ